MVNLKWISLALLLLTLLHACKKDSNNTPITYPNYTNLAVGNYWLYERFDVDTFGNSTPLGVYDSCYVEKDTTINAVKYFKMVRPSYALASPVTFIRDSLHYLIDMYGSVLFSSQNFIDTFNRYFVTAGIGDTVCYVVCKMADKDFLVTTVAGSFTTSCLKTTYYMYPNWAYAGNPRYLNTRYAPNIGIITETIPFYSGNSNYTERRLIRYKLQ